MQIQDQHLDHVCQFSVKMDNFEFFSLNLGKLPYYMRYFGSNTLTVLQRAGWRLKWDGWRWMHGLVMPIFLIWRKNNISFTRYLDFYAFVKSTDFKICDVIIGISTYWMPCLCLFLLKHKYHQIKLGQMLVCCMANISNMFLAQCWRLETSSRLFHDFIKMTI